jgi:hypothetical protein
MHPEPRRVQYVELTIEAGEQKQGVELSYGTANRSEPRTGQQEEEHHEESVGQEQPPARRLAGGPGSRDDRNHSQISQQQQVYIPERRGTGAAVMPMLYSGGYSHPACRYH